MTPHFSHRPLIVITLTLAFSACGVERKMDTTNAKMDVTVEKMQELKVQTKSSIDETNTKMDRTLEAMEKLHRTTSDGMKETNGNLIKTLDIMQKMSASTANLEKLTEKMSQTTGRMEQLTGKMANSVDKTNATTERVATSLEKTNATTERVHTAVESTNQGMKDTLIEIKKTNTSLESMLERMTDLEKKLTLATAVEQIIDVNKCHYIEDQLPLAEAIAANADSEKFVTLNKLWLSALQKDPAGSSPDAAKHEKLCRLQALVAINGLAEQSMIDAVIEKHIHAQSTAQSVAMQMLMFRYLYLNKLLPKYVGALGQSPSFARLTEAARILQGVDKIATLPFSSRIQIDEKLKPYLLASGEPTQLQIAAIETAWVALQEILQSGKVVGANKAEEDLLKTLAATIDEKVKYWTSADSSGMTTAEIIDPSQNPEDSYEGTTPQAAEPSAAPISQPSPPPSPILSPLPSPSPSAAVSRRFTPAVELLPMSDEEFYGATTAAIPSPVPSISASPSPIVSSDNEALEINNEEFTD